MNTPGISVEALIGSMNRRFLTGLLGNDIIRTLEHLFETEVDVQELRQVAVALYGGDNNAHTIRERETREQLIEALPLEKSQELCNILGVEPKGNIYKQLKRIQTVGRPETESAFFSFFGIVEDRTAQQIRKPTISEVSSVYGLFAHQRDVVIRTLNALNTPPYKTIIHMPTGAGKTRMAMHIVARHMQEHGPTLICWLANSAELLEQAAEDFEKSWKVLGDRPTKVFRFWGDRKLDLSEVKDGILISGFAKMYAAYQRDPNMLMILGDRASLTVVDEAHQAIAPTYRSVIEGLSTKRPNNALLGLTATPGRTWSDVEEDKELSSFFGGEKVTLTVEGYTDPVVFLMEEGYLARPIFQRIECNSAYGLSVDEAQTLEVSADLPEAIMNRIAHDQDRNYQIITGIEDLLKRCHTRIIVFGASVSHASLLAGILIARNHEAKIVTGKTPIARRDRIIRRFKSAGEKPIVVCNYGVLTTGFDAPKTSAAVIARPTKSLVLYSQMVGRATRGPKAGGNETAEILTVVDTSLPGFGSVEEAFHNWEDVWHEH